MKFTITLFCALSFTSYSVASTVIAATRLGTRDEVDQSRCDASPDPDIAGYGVRVGLWLQAVALGLTICSGSLRLASALPATIMSSIVYNMILSMKATGVVFTSYPVVQDFWVATGQLWVLTTVVPYAMLFQEWRVDYLGFTKGVMFIITVVYTYVQAFWFWSNGWKESDEKVCHTQESTLFSGHYELFSKNGKAALLVLYSIGLVIFVVAVPLSLRRRRGIFARVLDLVPTKFDSVKAVAMLLLLLPAYLFPIWFVEGTVRRGSQRVVMQSTGQWLALGLGVATLAEAIWQVLKAVRRELILGEPFSEDKIKEDKLESKQATGKRKKRGNESQAFLMDRLPY